MKIWILKDGDPVPGIDEGQRMLRSGIMAEYFNQQGHDVTLWCSTWSHAQKKFRCAEDKKMVLDCGIKINLLKSTGYEKNISLQRILHNKKLARNFFNASFQTERPDLIIASLPTVDFAYAGLRVAKKMKIPFLVDLRDKWPDIFVEIFNFPMNKLVRVLFNEQFAKMKKICSQATGLIGITESFLEWGVRYGRRTETDNDFVLPLVTPNNINCLAKKEKKVNQKVLDLLPVLEKSFVMVYAGSLQPSIDLGPVIKTMDKLPKSIVLVIAGASGLIEDYKKLAQNNDNIVFTNWLNQYELHLIYSQSNIALAPYVNKPYFTMNLTNKPIEYMSYGLPILTSVEGYLSNLIEKNKIGFFYEGKNIALLVEHIKRFFNHPSLLKQYSDNSRTYFDKQFDYSKTYSHFLNYIERVVEHEHDRCKS